MYFCIILYCILIIIIISNFVSILLDFVRCQPIIFITSSFWNSSSIQPVMPSIFLKGKEEIILLQNVPFIRISSVVDPQFLSDFLIENLERIKTIHQTGGNGSIG